MNNQAKTAKDLAYALSDVFLDVDRARAIISAIYETYFSFKCDDYLLASISNSHEDISLLLSTAIGFLHDSVKAFEQQDV